ncbi:hypothetical protein LEP1GSC203_2550 [Leptospira terpstrae serovar Hualin str. LT 11-33 = ATCC 700639]|uniref:Uncharacterized protein n=1 Tax=Leptospira terpstrae serovar Hualin str. LT 11-33 = ATCC 700639 TaxID=1257025 RepID=N1VKY0_9LEPT|nr:hypothetical protein LEP1GSC203_2550 [Leptospira terpstrae serovar Hualin str. LT 11-33 = ATCC 700639]
MAMGVSSFYSSAKLGKPKEKNYVTLKKGKAGKGLGRIFRPDRFP